MSKESEKRSGGSTIWPWALVTGLAVGFLVGREVGPRSGGEAADDRPRPSAAAVAAAPGKVYATEAEFPPGWLKAADLTSVAGVSFDGMKDGQKAAAMQALNERNCECGCGKGSVAFCAKNDTACPVSPKLVKEVVERAKQGNGVGELFAYLDTANPKKGGAGAGQAAAPAGPRKVTIPAHAPRKGPKAAKVTIVEFSDFQCPFCSRVNPTLKQIQDTYGKDVAIVFVNQPLSFHAQARDAAKAFLAANRQGKAWELHDKMFANQQALMPADLERYAGEVGLNVAKWKKDLADPEIEKQVAADQALAASVGADGTPAFYINGRELSGAQPFPSFKAIIDEEIKKADELVKKGTKLEDVYGKLMEQAAAAPAPAPSPSGAAAPAAAPVDVMVGAAPSKGPASAKVTIVTFSDFQCPFCSRVVPTFQKIEEEYKGKVRIAFKHLPLPFHDKAGIAAEASMAAHEQGKFWQMHDKLFANQQALDRPSLEKYAQELGLDMKKFKAALDAGKYKKHVEEDAKYAANVGASGTPTSFVNGKAVVGAVPFDDFKREIDAALASAK